MGAQEKEKDSKYTHHHPFCCLVSSPLLPSSLILIFQPVITNYHLSNTSASNIKLIVPLKDIPVCCMRLPVSSHFLTSYTLRRECSECVCNGPCTATSRAVV